MLERDTATAAQATVGHWAQKLPLTAMPANLLLLSPAYNRLTRPLPRTHAKRVSLSLSYRLHDIHMHLGMMGYNGDQI